jgi:hypothetical protein
MTYADTPNARTTISCGDNTKIRIQAAVRTVHQGLRCLELKVSGAPANEYELSPTLPLEVTVYLPDNDDSLESLILGILHDCPNLKAKLFNLEVGDPRAGGMLLEIPPDLSPEANGIDPDYEQTVADGTCEFHSTAGCEYGCL